MDLASFRTDTDAEVEGVWMDLADGVRVKVARMYNEKMVRAFSRIPPAVRNNIENMRLEESVTAKMYADLLAKYVLLDWEGLAEDGEELTYSVDNARRILADPQYKNFRGLVIDLANTASIYHKEMVAEKAKNLESD